MGARSRTSSEGYAESLTGKAVQRQILATAQRYRRKGYKVALASRGDPFPNFLQGCAPDLVAERDDDRVVVLVKSADAVRGSNDLVTLAELVDGMPSWRFEFISLPGQAVSKMPALDSIADEVRGLVNMGAVMPAFVLAFAAVEEMVQCLALRIGVNPANEPFGQLVRSLVVAGVLSSQARDSIITASAKRSGLVHGADENVSRAEVDALLTLVAHVRDEAAEAEAA